MLSADDWLRLDQRALGALLGRAQPTVSQALNHLAAAGALARTGKGPGVRYRLAPHIQWAAPAARFHTDRYGVGLDSSCSPPPPPPPATSTPADDVRFLTPKARLAQAREELEGQRARLDSAVRTFAMTPDHPPLAKRQAKWRIEEEEALFKVALREVQRARKAQGMAGR